MTNQNMKDLGQEPTGRGALRPKARLLRTLGSDLISSDKVALLELVKNAYDADAHAVVIRFHGPLTKGEGQIEVWDDGHGMDLKTLQSSWLDIASDSKKRNPLSTKGRRVLGEKGIGRLAASRLGDEMLLQTRKHESQEVSLLIDWSDFDRDDAYLDEVEVAWEVSEPRMFAIPGQSGVVFNDAESPNYNSGRGTLVQVGKLNRSWTRDDLLELRTALMRLIRPRPVSPDNESTRTVVEPDFQIYLEMLAVAADVEDLSGAVGTSPELQTPHYSLKGKLDNLGVASMTYAQDEPPLIEKIESKRLWQDESRPPQAGPFEFEINVWDRDATALRRALNASSGEGLSPSTKDLKGFRDILDEVTGVSIYRDGFRVLPFGESGDDWLGLDLRRVQTPTRRVSNNQILGHIFIGADTNRGLKDQSNREGLLAGIPYDDLQFLVRAALNELETRRYIARRPTKTKKTEKSGLFRRFDLEDLRTNFASSYPSDRKILQLLDDKNKEIQQGIEEVQNVLSRYSRLATLGSLVDRILHDGRSVVTRLKATSRFGLRDLNKSTSSMTEKIDLAKEAMEKNHNQAEILSSIFKQIEPFGGRKRGKPKVIDTADAIKKTISILQQEADDRRVQIVSTSPSIKVRYDEAELMTVLINLVQNAIYWAASIPQPENRQVSLEARRNADDTVSFLISDTGPGVPAELREHIFDPYFSSKPDGVGLGLSIAGNIVENIYEGELSLLEKGPLNGATFEAMFNKRSK